MRAIKYNDNIQKLFLIVLLLFSTWLSLKHFWVCDDAFISFRFAKNFALGEGLRFNIANEIPVEGYSNFLWVILAAFFEFIGIASYTIIPYISLIAGLILSWKVYQAGIKYFDLSPNLALLASAFLALFPPIIIWNTSGLEPLPFALFTFLVFEQLFFKKQANFFWLCIYCLGLCLIRAEGPLWALTFAFMAIVFSSSDKKTIFKYLLFVLLVIAIQTYFRYSYYQEFFPNTASTKVAFSSLRLERGFNYITTFALTFVTPLLAIFGLIFGLSKLTFLTFLGFIGFYAYSLLSGGDYMTMGRFLIPSIAFQALLLAVLVKQISKYNRTAAVLTSLTLITCSFFPLYQKHLIPQKIRAQFHFRWNTNKFIDERQQWNFMKENSRRWEYKGRWLKEHSTPGDSLVEGTIGNVGYFSDLYIYDRLGLVSKLPAKFKRTVPRSAGHDLKAPLSYFTPNNPTYLYANLERLDRFRRMHELKKHYPYAPYLFATDFKANKPYQMVVLKKTSTQDQYQELWSNLENKISAKSN